MSAIIRWLGGKGLGQTLVGTLIGTGIVNSFILYNEKRKEEISKTNAVAKKNLPLSPAAKKLDNKFLFLKQGNYSDVENKRVLKDLETNNFVRCPPDDPITAPWYVTGIKDPCVCEVIRDKAKRELYLYKRMLELMEDSEDFRKDQAKRFLEESRNSMRTPTVYKAERIP